MDVVPLPRETLEPPLTGIGPPVVRAEDAVWVVKRDLNVGVELLVPIFVADDQEVDHASRGQHNVTREEARGRGVAAHLLQCPVVPRARQVVGARGPRRHLGALRQGGLLPRHHAPLPVDLQEHLVLVPRLARLCRAESEGVHAHVRKGLLVPARPVGQALDDALAVLVARHTATAVDHPRRSHGAPRDLGAPLEVGVGALDRTTLWHPRQSWVKHALRAAVQPDLELLPPVLAERHRESVLAGGGPVHPLRGLPPGPSSNDEVAVLLARQQLMLDLPPASRPEGDLGRSHRWWRKDLCYILHGPSQQVDVGAAKSLGQDAGETARP
mmetsp:Transcript_69629/g.207473  ORF Transcript_69629/g.207473 Transcript_69629/m.207473 type:complete len:327 (-) Transcript_69629:1433-2413(-)